MAPTEPFITRCEQTAADEYFLGAAAFSQRHLLTATPDEMPLNGRQNLGEGFSKPEDGGGE